jgi:acetyl esterase/lipase
MKRSLVAALLALASCSGGDRSVAPPVERVRLWPGRAPVGDGTFETVTTELEVYRPAPGNATGVAVVVCPGGGYIRHVMDREGYPIADWLTANGIAAILLRYRLPEGRPLVALLDARRAGRVVRFRAADWGIDPHRIGILGFSAGGHVASTAATHPEDGRAGDPDPVEREPTRPDFAGLVYPVVTMGEGTHPLSKSKLLGPDPTPERVREFSNELQVRGTTPPAFLAHAADDASVPPSNSRNFVAAMKAHGVPVEYVEFPTGGHGFNGCKGPVWEAWKARFLEWLRSRGVLHS